MISGTRAALLLASALTAPLAAAASAPDAPTPRATVSSAPAGPAALPTASPPSALDALLARIARPAPASVAYAEVRFSKLLTAPVVTSGRLEYTGADTLAKHVDAPYREDLYVERDEVRIERAGQATRRIPLQRAPELRGLLASFGALLGGNRAALERVFTLELVGAAAPGDATRAVGAPATPTGGASAWRLAMTPRDSRVRSRLKRVDVLGRADAPRCLTVLQGDGTTSTMLFAELAREAWPTTFGPELVARRCESGAP